MRWTVIVLAAAIAVTGGCARDNPYFDGADAGATSSATKGGDASQGGDDGGADSTTFSSMSAGATTGPPGPEETGSPATDGPGDTGTPPACLVDEAVLMEVSAVSDLGDTLEFPCGAEVELLGQRSISDGQLVITECGTCDCVDPGANYLVEISDAGVDVAALIAMGGQDCAGVIVRRATAELGCHVELAIVWAGTPSNPVMIATNERQPAGSLLPVALGAPLSTCEDSACQPAAGEYAVDVGGIPFTPGVPQTVMLMLPAAMAILTADLLVRFAYIDPACKEHVGWTLSRAPGG